MPEIIPFKGIFYNQEKIKDLEKASAPPYDVISSEAQDRYYDNSPHNIIRLIFGKEFPSDNKLNNQYIRAGRLFKAWLRKKILIEDKKPSFYFYCLDYQISGRRKRLSGFIALIKLERFAQGKVFPHEKTLSPAKDHCLKTLRACRANFNPVFSLYQDKGSQIEKILREGMKSSPLIEVKDENKVRHRLWAVSEQSKLSLIKKEMRDKLIFIADGHHRYETALRFSQELAKREKSPSIKKLHNYLMMFFTNMDGRGLTILPAQRLIRKIKRFKMSKIAQSFEIEILGFGKSNELKQRERMFERMRELGRKKIVFGMYKGGSKYYLLILRDEFKKERLDIKILHNFLINNILGIEEEDVDYLKDEEKAISLVKEGEYRAILFHNPTRINDLRRVACSGGIMPPKSTYFYPKLLSGLVMNKF